MSKPRAPVASERAEVVALLEWLVLSGPPLDCWYCTIPAGDGKMVTAPGYFAGAPDMIFIFHGKTIALEMKRVRGGRLSAAQVAAHQRITLAGGLVIIAYGWQDAAAQLAMLIPFRTQISVAA